MQMHPFCSSMHWLLLKAQNMASIWSTFPISRIILTILLGMFFILHMNVYVGHFIHRHFARFSLVFATVFGALKFNYKCRMRTLGMLESISSIPAYLMCAFCICN